MGMTRIQARAEISSRSPVTPRHAGGPPARLWSKRILGGDLEDPVAPVVMEMIENAIANMEKNRSDRLSSGL